ncbi:S1/P1 nuclease [Atractiella rhizophila]|nr:S1/P1 nuclease [Atractiella rhizophila]
MDFELAGHQVVAYVAQDFVTTQGATLVQGALGNSSSSYMADVASWADSYRYTSAGAWSAPLHYIDALDSPPDDCNVDFDRDCTGSGCFVSAIVNYTNIMLASGSSVLLKKDAVRFLIHFIGDIHQPKHDENLDKGGNGIDVLYNGADTNLHSVWDTSLLQTLAGGSTETVARTYATSLTKAIKAGTWSASSWINGISIADPESAAMKWANEANGYVCSDVMPDGVSAVEGQDLSGTYYSDHNHVVRIQLARAGYRLATWLDLIAAA